MNNINWDDIFLNLQVSYGILLKWVINKDFIKKIII